MSSRNILIVSSNELPTLNTGGYRKIICTCFARWKTQQIDTNIYLQYHSNVLEFKETISNLDQHAADPFSKFKPFKRIIPRFLRLELRIQKSNSDLIKSISKSQIQFDVVHFHNSTYKQKCLELIKKKNKNALIITTFHSKGSVSEDWMDQWGFKNISWYKKILLNREKKQIIYSDIITFPSNGSFELAKKDFGLDIFKNKNVVVIYNGIDIAKLNSINTEIKPINPKKIKIINVAEHSSFKRVDLALKIISSISKKHEIEFIQIGKGADLNNNIDLAKKLGIQDICTFYPSLPNPELITLLKQSDIYFMPSINIVFDLIVLEAMGCHLPVVLTKEGGNLEIINHGIDGFLCDRNDINAYEKCIIELIEKPELRKTLGINANSKINQTYTDFNMANNYYRLYCHNFKS